MNINDMFIDALPDDIYGFCPCGCCKKIKFIIKEGEEEAQKHFNEFKRQHEIQE